MRSAAAALVLLVALGGARADDPPAAAPPRDPWIAHGLKADARDGLRAFLAAAVEHDETAGGALRIEHHGEVVFEEGFGLADRKSKRPFSAADPVRIASISKCMVAALVTALAGDGKIDLEAPIDRYLPEFRGAKLASGAAASRVPLVRELLAHTAGFIPDDAEGGRPWLAKHPDGWTLAQQVAADAAAGLHHEPGLRMSYSGTGYEVAGRIVEVVTKEPLEDAIEERLFRPLGMTRTTYLPDAATRAALPTYYFQWRSDGRLHADLTPYVFAAKGLYRSVGGGVVSTLADVATFFRMHAAGGRVGEKAFLPEKLHREMLLHRAPWQRYGLGLVLGPPKSKDDDHPVWISHSGSTGTLAWVDWEHDWSGVLFTQGHRVDGRPAKDAAPAIGKDEPEFPRAAKARLDAIFGWTDWPK